MRTNDHKKNNHYGVLCGLRANALGDSDSDASRSSTPEPPPKDEIHVRPPIAPVNQRRPQSLTLPFENRNRESHLVSEEEFDRIVRQAELDDGVPSLPTTRPRNVSTGGLRRSISTARNTAFLRQRPVSLDVGSLVALSAQGRDKGRPDSLSRDSTLTALPRLPTINQMAVYPGRIPPSTSQQQQSSSPSTQKSHMRNASTANGNDNVFKELFQQGHKRNRSAAQVVESVKKRLKRSPNSPKFDIESGGSGASKISLGSPIKFPTSYAAAVQYQYGQTTNDAAPASDSPVDTFAKPAKQIIADSANLKKSLLVRTWSRTKQHAKKFSISYTSSNDSRPSISEPTSLQMQVRPETAQSTHTETSTAGSVATSRYYASAEPSPRCTHESSRAGTPNSETQDRDIEFISGPPPRKNILTRMGAPPRRSELNTVVARQQSRITDLTLLNNVLVQQVETLRGEVEGMNAVSKQKRGQYTSNASGPGMMRQQMSDSDSGYSADGGSNYDSEQENYGRVRGGGGRKRKSDGAVSAWSSSVSARRRISSGRVLRDPEGWKHIMGVGVDGDRGNDGDRMDVDGIGEDRRKTWMTCDTES